jgi:hypothetical protein
MPTRTAPLAASLSLATLASLLAGAAISAPAAPPVRTRLPMVAGEQAIETEAGSVELPESLGGSLTVRTCATCPSEHYATDPQTRYLARGSLLSASEWQALARTNAHTPATVLLDARSHVVTRVLVDLPAPARRTP